MPSPAAPRDLRWVGRTILTGLFTLLPLGLTVYILWWLAHAAESLLAGLLQAVAPGFYVPGMGLAAALALAFLVGLAMRAWLVQRLFALGEAALYRIPVVKGVYGSIRDFLHFVYAPEQEGLGKVVAFRLPGAPSVRLIGFLTREEVPGLEGQDLVAVYLPFSYQIGGYTVLVPRERLEPVAMSMEEAMRFTLTAGVVRRHGVRTGGPRRGRGGEAKAG